MNDNKAEVCSRWQSSDTQLGYDTREEIAQVVRMAAICGLSLPLTAQILATGSQMNMHSLWAEWQDGSQARSWRPWCFNRLCMVALDNQDMELRCVTPNIHSGPGA